MIYILKLTHNLRNEVCQVPGFSGDGREGSARAENMSGPRSDEAVSQPAVLDPWTNHRPAVVWRAADCSGRRKSDPSTTNENYPSALCPERERRVLPTPSLIRLPSS